MKYLLFLILNVPLLCFSQISGKVVGISDGDTFTLLSKDSFQIKIRFHGIDCPETGQPFSNVSKRFLSDLIFGQTVFIEKRGVDRYGRTLAIVFKDTINVNEALLSNGIAWHFKRYDNNPVWAEIENDAREKKRGLWSDKDPIPPWEWRKLKK